MQYIWIVGGEKETKETIEALRANGFSFELDCFFEISNSPFGSDRYSYTLKNFLPPTVVTPQPRQWDVVLGGKK